MKKYLCFLMLILFSCGDNSAVLWICNCEQQKEVRIFVENNIKSANNMSDEEMEDVIKELYRTGVKTICLKRQIVYEVSNGNMVNIRGLQKCETIADVY